MDLPKGILTVKVTDWFGPARESDDDTFTLIGWRWYRNGSWNCRHAFINGRPRLFYIYTGPIICNRVLEVLIDFKWTLLKKPNPAPI